MGGRAVLFASLALAFAAWGSMAEAAAPERCDLGKFAELPVTMVGMRPRVDVKIDGVDTPFTVDSGSFFSVMNRATVQRLGLSTKMAPFGFAVRGAGGSDNRVDVATVKRFGLGAIDVPDVPFLSLPDVESSSAGLLGQNVLSLFDTEYDIGNGVIRLLKPSPACAHANVAYWAAGQTIGVVEVEAINNEQRHLRGTATINGQKVRVIFDTGASSSVLKRSTAERLGFRVDGPGVQARGAARGIGPHAVETWTAPFDVFEIGGERIEHTRLQVGDLDVFGDDMLLGIDFFLSHRIYVSKQQRKIFFTYNGGPVFRLEPVVGRPAQAAAGPPPVAAAPGAPAPAAPADRYADAPTDAAGFVRRAEASMARRDFTAAVADFTRAIELEPANPQHYLQRANAHLGARAPVLAMADFDQVLKLRPGNAAALVGRGRLYMISRDVVRGQADLDAAVKADPDTALLVGAIYANNQHFEPAITNFDLWIGRHPDASDIADALATRCRVRILWNHDLDKALADCEAAIRHGPRTAAMFESRGLAHLRRGESDPALADFNQALKLQPKLAWALYGRSLVERAKGQGPTADVDLAAAAAIAPRMPQTAREYGFEGPAPAAKAAG
ncbi:MAG: tetratricopeptide repeat protein [Phenylobacterium sp.]|nr:MAG: tetratricopeptide repeat protein [Phenylobacterium sp.]